MKVEWPECKRCCFCMPLRRGLLTWGYIKLLISLLVVTANYGYIILFFRAINAGYEVDLDIYIDILVGIVIMVMLLLDTALTIVLIIGGHRKSPKLLRIYYIYDIVVTCVVGLLLIAFFILITLDIIIYTRGKSLAYITFTVYADVLAVFLFIAIQGYVLLLVRSEVNKLNVNNSNFRFVNNAADAKCSMEDVQLNCDVQCPPNV